MYGGPQGEDLNVRNRLMLGVNGLWHGYMMKVSYRVNEPEWSSSASSSHSSRQ